MSCVLELAGLAERQPVGRTRDGPGLVNCFEDNDQISRVSDR